MQKTTLRKGSILILILILITSSSLTIGQPTNHRLTIYVGGTGPYNFTTIQAAINFAAPGDSIYIFNDTYYENIVITKQLTISGENLNTYIIGAISSNTVDISSNNVSLSRISIKNGTHCIDINADYVKVTNVFVSESIYAAIEVNGNLCSISNCTVFDSNQTGIELRNYIDGVNNNSIKNNMINNCSIGIAIVHHFNTGPCQHNQISQNNIYDCNNGIYINGSNNNNTIYFNNLINNTANSYDSCTNSWDTGYPTGGNFWDDYTGIDADDDGIGDTPYPIPGGTNHDNYPLMNPYGTPIAHFTYTINTMTVDFDASTSTDPDGTITSYNWEFGDNTTGTGMTIQHIYNHTAIYQVNLTITDNENNSDTYTQTFLLNTPPYTPNNPHPINSSTGICNTTLSWTGGDPNTEDTVTYDIYFGPTTPPPKLISNHTTTTYDPGFLPPCTTYHWKIISWDNHDAHTSGPLWHFRTNCPPNQPSDPDPIHHATDVSVTTLLSWNATDPDTTQTLTYDVYFGTTTPPPKLISNQTSTNFLPGTLSFNKKYYWYVTTWDSCNISTTGPIWDFTTELFHPIPDLDCVGSLSWIKIPPGSIQHGAFTIINIGDANSKLNWIIASTPDWGEWNITPDHGLGLTPQAGPLIITVEVTAPNVPQSDFSGNIKILNLDDPTDYELIPVTLSTPTPTHQSLLFSFFNQLLHRFPLLYHLLELFFSLLVG